MKTAAITAYGGPDALTIRDAVIPEPGESEALVAVVASTVNPVDLKTLTPHMPQQVGRFPAVLGWDLAGIVVSAPEETGYGPGDRVIALNPPKPDGSGSWQQYVALPTELLVPAPESVDLLHAAALTVPVLTADQALNRLGLNVNDRLLVTGAAGGVGGMAVQLAAAAGVTPVGLVSRPDHEQAALDLGAASARSDPADIGEFDAIVDTAGIFRTELLREGGRLVTVSDDAIPSALADRAAFAVHNYVGYDRARLHEFCAMVDDGGVTLRIAERYPLSQIREALRSVESGGLLGKVVLTM
ncbi:MAG: NADP-dependent oxidoreductase [Brevibacterium sp.]